MGQAKVVNLGCWNPTPFIANETVTQLKFGAWKKIHLREIFTVGTEVDGP